MPLSNKKLKYIRRHASSKSPGEIAEALGLSVEEVTPVIAEATGKPVPSGKDWADSLAFFLLLAMVFLAPFPILKQGFSFANLPKAALIQTGSLLLLSVWLFKCWQTGKVSLIRSVSYVPLTVFLVWAGLSMLWATDKYGAFTQWVHWASCGLFFFLTLQMTSGEGRKRKLYTAVLLSGALIALLGILQYLNGLDWFYQKAAPASTFGNKNVATQFVVLTAPAAFYLLFSARKQIVVWLSGCALSCIYIYVFYTFTRSAWLAVLIQLVILAVYLAYELFYLKNRFSLGRKKVAASVLVLAAVLIMANFNSSGFSWKLGKAYGHLSGISSVVNKSQVKPSEKQATEKGQASIDIRLNRYRNTLELIKAHPLFGVGVYNFQSQYPAYTLQEYRDPEVQLFKRPKEAHNDYLQIVSELGLPAFILILWIFWFALKTGYRQLAPRTSIEDRLLIVSILASLTGLAVNACFSFPLYRPLPPFLFAIHLAVLGRMAADLSVSASEQDSLFNFSIPKTALAGAVLALLSTGAWAWVQDRWIKADKQYVIQRNLIRQSEWNAAAKWGEKVKEYDSLRPETYQTTGSALLKIRKYKAAKEELYRYNHAFPYSVSNLYYLGQCHLHLKEYDLAEQMLLKAISIVPDEGWLYQILSEVYTATGQKGKAFDALQSATEAAPEESSFFYDLATTALSLNRYEDAARALDKAASLDKKSDLYHGLLGDILFFHLDRKDEGVNHMKIALSLNPNTRRARKLRQAIKEYESSGSESRANTSEE